MNKLSLSKIWTIALGTFLCCQVGHAADAPTRPAASAKPSAAAKPPTARPTATAARPATAPATAAPAPAVPVPVPAGSGWQIEDTRNETASCKRLKDMEKAADRYKAADIEKQKKQCEFSVRRKSEKENSESCTKANDEYKKAQEDLNKSCGKAGILVSIAQSMGAGEQSESGRSSMNPCVRNLVRCEMCAGQEDASFAGEPISCGKWEGASKDDRDPSDEKPSAGALGALNSTMSTFMGASLQNQKSSGKTEKELRDEIGSCVPRSAEELEDLRRETGDAKKAIERYQEQVNKKNREIMEARQEATDKQNTTQDRSEALQAKAKEEIEKLQSKLDEATRQATQVFTERTMTTENEISQLQLATVQAQNVENEALAQLDRGCHMAALKAAEDERQRIIALISQNAYTSGGFSETMANTGRSTTQELKALAAKAYNECRSDEGYRSAKTSAARAKSFAIQQAQDQINKRRQLLVTNRAEFLKGKSSQTEQTIKQITRISENLEKALQSVARESTSEGTKASQKQLATMLEFNMLNRHLQDSESEMAYKTERARLIRKLAGNNKVKPGAVDEALGDFTTTKRKAQDVINQCCVEDEDEATAMGNDALRFCKAAKSFLYGSDQTAATSPTSQPTVTPIGSGGRGTR